MTNTEKCQFFANCVNEATTTVEHPVLLQVACCERCADWYTK